MVVPKLCLQLSLAWGPSTSALLGSNNKTNINHKHCDMCCKAAILWMLLFVVIDEPSSKSSTLQHFTQVSWVAKKVCFLLQNVLLSSGTIFKFDLEPGGIPYSIWHILRLNAAKPSPILKTSILICCIRMTIWNFQKDWYRWFYSLETNWTCSQQKVCHH